LLGVAVSCLSTRDALPRISKKSVLLRSVYMNLVIGSFFSKEEVIFEDETDRVL